MSDNAPAFSWSRSKRDENWRLRKVDFAVAVGIFDDPDRLEAPDTRNDYGEERLQALGTTDNTLYLVVYTWRGSTRHIITAWKVGKKALNDIETFSREDIKRMKAARQTPQQKSKVPALELDESFWQAAAFVHERPKRKASIHLRIDQDILDHFRNEGPGHLTRMANILKAYVEASRSTR